MSKRGRPKKYTPLQIPSTYEKMEEFILDNKFKLMNHIIDSIEYSIKNNIDIFEVIKFENTDYTVTLQKDNHLDNIDNMYDECLKLEYYELCPRLLEIKCILTDTNYANSKKSNKKRHKPNGPSRQKN